MDTPTFIKQFTEDLLDKLAIRAGVKVEEEDESFTVKIDGDNLGSLIGHHGDTLHNFQHILNVATAQQAGELIRVIVDAGDWRQSRMEQLDRMAMKALDQVRDSGRDYHFPPMNPSDRRFVHEILGKYDDITTESEGEGRDRHIVLKKVVS